MVAEIVNNGNDRTYTIGNGDGAVKVSLARGTTSIYFKDRTRAEVLSEIDGAVNVSAQTLN